MQSQAPYSADGVRIHVLLTRRGKIPVSSWDLRFRCITGLWCGDLAFSQCTYDPVLYTYENSPWLIITDLTTFMNRSQSWNNQADLDLYIKESKVHCSTEDVTSHNLLLKQMPFSLYFVILSMPVQDLMVRC